MIIKNKILYFIQIRHTVDFPPASVFKVCKARTHTIHVYTPASNTHNEMCKPKIHSSPPAGHSAEGCNCARIFPDYNKSIE